MILKIKTDKKRKAFTLIELMLLLLVLSMIIASSYSLITRKHRVVPQKAVHGQYLCLKEISPRVGARTALEASDAPPCTASESREIKLSGSIITKNHCVAECAFDFPKSASYIYLQLIGGGGAGGNANYNPRLDSMYKKLTYDRGINIAEADWRWIETKKHSTDIHPKSSSSGHNLVTKIKSWGGATTFKSKNNLTQISDDYPKVQGNLSACSSGQCYDEVTDNDLRSPTMLGSAINNGDLNGTGFPSSGNRGITRDYVDKHFTFFAQQNFPNPNVKGAVTTTSLNSGALMDSKLFQYLVSTFVVDKMFAYDSGGKGPSSPGYSIKPLKAQSTGANMYNNYVCKNYSGGLVSVNDFRNCVAYAFDRGYLGTGATAGKNPLCSLPPASGKDIPNGPASVTESGSATSRLNPDDLLWNSMSKSTKTQSITTILNYCPLMKRYWARSSDSIQACSGGAGGAGSYFTSKPISGFHYEFFPVLGIRWNRDEFLNSNDSVCADSETGSDFDNTVKNFLCYKRHNARAVTTTSHQDDSIDFGGSNTNVTVTVAPQIAYPMNSSTSLITCNDIYGTSGLKDNQSWAGTLKACPVDTDPMPSYCIEVNGTRYKKMQVGTTSLNAPDFDVFPQILESYYVESPTLDVNDYNYWVGGYPHGFGTNHNGVGVAYSYQDGNSTQTNDADITKPAQFDRSRTDFNSQYNACIAPGVSAHSNNHQITEGNVDIPSDITLPAEVRSGNKYLTNIQGSAANNATRYTPVMFIFSSDYIPGTKSNSIASTSTYCNYYNDATSYFGKDCFETWSNTENLWGYGPRHRWLKTILTSTGDKPHDSNWIQCYESNETMQCMESTSLSPQYIAEAFGMSATTSQSSLAYDCLNTPLKRLASSDGNAIMPDIANSSKSVEERALSARIPHAFGTPNNSPWNITESALREHVLNEDGSFKSCNQAPENSAPGNTGFDTTTYEGRLAFVGNTGFVLKEYKKFNNKTQYRDEKNYTRNNILGVVDSSTLAQPNSTATLDSEDEMGLKIRLTYYAHALSYGRPGQSGNYKGIFARSFTNSRVRILPGNGGTAATIDPRSANRGNVGAWGDDTRVLYNCDNNNENCQTFSVRGGAPGESGIVDPLEYGVLHQNHDFIKRAYKKLESIKSRGLQADLSQKNSDEQDSQQNYEHYNIFPHCSRQAPPPTEDNIEIYRHPTSGATLIDADCYGNGGVLADDSVFATKANLFDLSVLLGDVDPTLIGKGGDGGFVRDDCWVVPQYFEIRGLYYINLGASVTSNDPLHPDGDAATTNDYHYGNTESEYANGLYGGTASINTNTANGFYYLPNIEDDGYHADGLNTDTNSGWTRINPYLIHGNNNTACRRRGPRYLGYGASYIENDSDAYESYMNTDTPGIKEGDEYVYSVDNKVVKKVKYRVTGYKNDAATNSIFGTEIGGTDGYPGAVFITW